MKTSMAVGLVGLVLSTLTPAQDASPAAAAKTPGTLERLHQRIPEVAISDVPLDQFVDWLAQHTSTQIVVRWQVLTDSGIDRDKAITLNVRNLRFSQVLWMLLNEAGGTDVKLAYRASGNLILLSTDDDLGRETLTKAYDVSDLLVRIPRFRGGPQVEFTGQQGGGAQRPALGDSAGGEDEPEITDDQPGEVDPELLQLIGIIREAIEPGSWDGSGGNGTIRAFRRQLIVRNNLRVHQLLGGSVAANE